MTAPIVPRRPGPPWPVLGLLAALVLLAHALALQLRPARLGLAPAPPPARVAVLQTRTVAAPPPPAARPPAAPALSAPARPAPKPVLKKKPAPAQAPPAPPAMDSIASAAPPADAPPAAPSVPPPDASPPEAGSAAADGPRAPGQGGAPAPGTPAPAPGPAPPAQAPPQTPAMAVALPASARLTYQMTGSAKGLTYHAKGALDWANAEGRYSAHMTVRALFLGARTMESAGQVGPHGLAPLRFADKGKTEVAAHFEPDKGRISFSANTPPAPWQPGAQDRVSVVLQLGGLLAANPAGFADGSTITVFTVGPRDAEDWTFRVEGAEVLQLPYGELATLRLARQPRRPYDQKVELWYAPALGYLPVRNKITQASGDFVDQALSEVARP